MIFILILILLLLLILRISTLNSNSYISILDIFISIISTIIVSRFYFNRTNHIAFCNEILIPICELNECNEIINKIQDCKKLFIYQYGKKEEREAINELCDVAQLAKENAYNIAFKESIWNYFFYLYGWERKHPRYVREINGTIFEPIYNENLLKLEDYSVFFVDECNYDNNKQKELGRLLYNFYKDNDGTEKNIIFKDKNVCEIFYESNEYKLYKKAFDNFEKKKAKIKQLKLCKNM